ncbi:hypothetical protein LTR10_020425 [Elasticomyces elasticus]|uniref:Uncharacterized protein n=1 Tax=Exophiala sideris TaxID=1016849 RepID=A0ABR0J414_9EURO|nr:hypothetical protein LTR10_020425 [Elasticomyces elasticus]KAK5027050.1 hypothetical protein LTS07_007349 [Exophiala sideris]KAK5034054.1 hypothetical protein LTR13_006654 [Exophiala sideris]KAK5055670.1 hypothetical protein LTR69_008044 [Exophiala sideris]KAK5180996.1 hypothetical protein LTR44_006816 [Eurotiomycetes sp. CCFEE 6388]
MADRTEERPWSDISARLQNLRNLLSSERHSGADQQQAFEAFDREMDHQMAADRSAARERRRRDLETHAQEQDVASISENLPQSSSTASHVRARRRAVRPSERLQRYQRERLGHTSRAAAIEGHMTPFHPSPSAAQTSNDRGERLRSKRRKLDDGTYEDEPRTFNYGHYGQVMPGQLRMEIVTCDGGEYSDPQVPINSYPQNVLLDDASVYCTKTNRCNLLLKHVGGMPFTLTKIVVKAPRAGFDAPIQEGLVFIAMEDDSLLEKTSRYDMRWSPRNHRFRHRPDLHRPSHEYMDSTRSPLRSIDRSRYLNNPTELDDALEPDTTLVPGFDVSVGDPSDEEDARDSPPSPRPWHHDDDYSLRSYVDRYRPLSFPNEHSPSASTWDPSSDSEGYELDFLHVDDRVPGDIDRSQRQPVDSESTLAHRNHMLDLMRAQQAINNDNSFGRRERRHEQTEIAAYDQRSSRGETVVPGGELRAGLASFSEHAARMLRACHDPSATKTARGDPGASSSARSNAIMPHARFFISRSKSSAAIKFDPPVSGRYILVKLWASYPNANIDVQAILAHGYGGPRFFPSIETR